MSLPMRPREIAEIAKRTAARTQPFDAAMREFLDNWQSLNPAQKKVALEEEPILLGPTHDAYLAALAEHLALSEKLPPPKWVESTTRFLREPFFAGGLESLKATLLVESPLAFRRRQIFISTDALSRPSRQPAETF
jgi:hypothetical protein